MLEGLVDQLRKIQESAPRVAVLTGPASIEDRLYFARTAQDALSQLDVSRALLRIGARCAEILDITLRPDWHHVATEFDIVFINLHGTPGEDGSIQGYLQTAGVPFVGSGVEASVIGLNKHLSKLVALSLDVPTPPFVVVNNESILGLRAHVSGAMICKPLRGGSSIDVQLLAHDDEFPTTGSWIVEEFVRGDDVTVTVIDVEGCPLALPAIQLEHDGAFYGQQEKLGPWRGPRLQALRPRRLHTAFSRCEDIALKMHRAVGARHITRSDFVVQADSDVQFLEMNTLPGISAHSLTARCAATAHVEYDDFIALLLSAAMST